MATGIQKRRRALVGAALATTVVLGTVGIASGAIGSRGDSETFYACMTRGGVIWPTTIRKGDAPRSCPLRSDTVVSWSASSGAGTQGPVGPAGATGPTGPTGPAGETGAAGADGAAGRDGIDGRDGVDGTNGTDGTDGRDGASILTGTGAPTSDVGTDGDLYLDTATYLLYGPKAGGAWPAEGVSLVGPQGPEGPAGPQGPEGPTGPQGPEGPTGGTTTTTTAPEQVLFDVILVNGGGNKLAVVKVVKDLTGMGLKEAMEAVDNAPTIIKSGISKDEAEALKRELVGAGAEVDIR